MIRRLLKIIAAPVTLALLSACANLNTIDRTTSLGGEEAKAVHLDVQQRLLIVNKLGRYCAEPSPDAMAAYAAALGVGASAPTKGAATVSGSGQGTAASIGLRTQSITLMRDALYRMCEAYANGAVGDAQVVTLLNRSQDLTTVILAVEQLTGAMAANQATLIGSSGANAYATALNNSKLFAEASANEVRALKRLEDSKTQQTAVSDKHVAAEEAVARGVDALTALESAIPRDEEKILNTKKELAIRRKLLDIAKVNLNSADARVELNQRVYDNAQSVAAEIAKTPDSSSASSSASTTGDSKTSTPTPRLELSKDATVAVAGAVNDIVTTALKKDYVIDSCMSVITSNRLSENIDIRLQELATREFCRRLINVLVLEKTVQAEARVQLATNSMIKIVTDDVDRILGCIAPNRSLDVAKRDQLFSDANDKVNGALTVYRDSIAGSSDESGMRKILVQNSSIRVALATVIGSSKACS